MIISIEDDIEVALRGGEEPEDGIEETGIFAVEVLEGESASAEAARSEVDDRIGNSVLLEGMIDGLLAGDLVELGFAGDAVGILWTALFGELEGMEGGEEDASGACRSRIGARDELWR